MRGGLAVGVGCPGPQTEAAAGATEPPGSSAGRRWSLPATPGQASAERHPTAARAAPAAAGGAALALQALQEGAEGGGRSCPTQTLAGFTARQSYRGLTDQYSTTGYY